MRKCFLSALMIPLLLFTGCVRRQAKPEEEFAAFREALRAADHAAFELALHERTDGAVADYALRVCYAGGECTVTVVQPQLLAGVTATVGPDGTQLGCEGVSLGVGAIAGMTPVTAGPNMLRAMAYGYGEVFWREDDTIAARIWLDDGAAMTLWLDANDTPLCAEIVQDGETVMSAEFSGWELY